MQFNHSRFIVIWFSAMFRGGLLAETASEKEVYSVANQQAHTLLKYGKLALEKPVSKLPFSLECKPSSFALGDGVYVRGSLPPGHAVAFFPGLCFPASPPDSALDIPMPVSRGSI
eukprot:m.82301 g.82301  ORF g.82301 m.82301 type:complete len:115 (+) comp12862_c0_seq2:170-514(+)